MVDAINYAYERLENQIKWYDYKSTWNQRLFKWLKMLEVSCAVSVTLFATLCPIVASLLGVSIVILESAQHIWQYQHNWITYRSTCEALKHEKFLYLSRAQQYNLPDQEVNKLLAERIESLISTEHAKWVMSKEKTKRTEK